MYADADEHRHENQCGYHNQEPRECIVAGGRDNRRVPSGLPRRVIWNGQRQECSDERDGRKCATNRELWMDVTRLAANRLSRPTEGFYDADSQRSGKRRIPNIVPTERTLPKNVGVRGLAAEGTLPKRLMFANRKTLQQRQPRPCVKTMLGASEAAKRLAIHIVAIRGAPAVRQRIRERVFGAGSGNAAITHLTFELENRRPVGDRDTQEKNPRDARRDVDGSCRAS